MATPEELAIIKNGKGGRGNFKVEDIERHKIYTAMELKALVKLMDIQREGLRTAIKDKPIELARWHGAGAIAKATLDLYIGGGKRDKETRARVRKMLGGLETDTPEKKERMDWVMRTYFGGRTDLVKQGNHRGVIHEYDIASAYPAIAVELPSMAGGSWIKVVNPTRQQVESASMVSMFHVRTHAYENGLPFYVLPFRSENGSIFYPPTVEGVYMRDHVIAAYKHYDLFEKEKRLCHYGINPHGPTLEIVSAWLFQPAEEGERPFAWIGDLFDYRTGLPKTHAGGQVIKLAINSIYGKFAESVGDPGRPPAFVSPWFAAAITAGTQRRVVEAALTNPDAVVMFATDGVYSTAPLDLVIPEKKTLGGWEHTVASAGGVFVQSGVYLLRYKPMKDAYANPTDEKAHFKCKTRGFFPKEIERREGVSFNQVVSEVLSRDIPDCWARGQSAYDFVYNNYLGLGISTVSRHSWSHIGEWKKKLRELNLDATEGKRRLARGSTKKAVDLRLSRAKRLVNLDATPFYPGMGLMSFPHKPKWLEDWEVESEGIIAGLSHE